jgi:tRNA(His) 5'-end guanylyltransferase
MGTKKDSLGDRMKEYEAVSRIRLVRRTPVIVRVDGKAFHTLTRGLKKPYDFDFIDCMWATAKALCKEVQGSQLAYVQSDEISLLLVDYKTKTTDAWFDNQIQKMVSISAAIATSTFSAEFQKKFPEKWEKGARPMFDSRVFNLPRHEVSNYFIWRQQDATRNSIQALGQAHFSHKELHGVSCDGIQEKLFQEKGINWNDESVHAKRGACVIRKPDPMLPSGRESWQFDVAIPVFTQDRSYIDDLVYGVEEYEDDK